MNDFIPFLKQLISAPGLSGYESPVCDLIEAAWQPLTDEIYLSRMGSLHGLRRGRGREPRPTLLMAAHMDAIGLMVSGIAGGFLRLARVGYLDPRVLPGQLVTVHGCTDLPGVIVQPPRHLLPEGVTEDQVGIQHLLVDTGLTAVEVEQQVRLGDLVSFAQPPFDLGEGYLAGHSLDNRASVAALTQCLAELQGRELHWDVCAVATTQEEETMVGARTAGYRVQPSLAVAIDVTFGRGPGSPANKTFPLGEGPTLGWGPVIHPGLHAAFKELGARLEIPYKMEIMPKTTGTDGDALQVSRGGVPTMVISIPLRYMHTPVEVVAIKDIQTTAHLLAEFAASLDGSFLDKLVWDD
jgi:endoglucanase